MLRIHFWPQISIADQTFKNQPNVESWCLCIRMGSESIFGLKSRSQIKLSKIGRMLNHDDYAIGWAQNPFLNSNLDRRSNFQISAECQIIIILHWVGFRIHFWPQILIADQNFKNRPTLESWWFFIRLGSESIFEIKSRSQIKLSKIGRMLNHDDFALRWAQNPFWTSNLDCRSKFQKTTECRIMMIFH